MSCKFFYFVSVDGRHGKWVAIASFRGRTLPKQNTTGMAKYPFHLWDSNPGPIVGGVRNTNPRTIWTTTRWFNSKLRNEFSHIFLLTKNFKKYSYYWQLTYSLICMDKLKRKFCYVANLQVFHYWLSMSKEMRCANIKTWYRKQDTKHLLWEFKFFQMMWKTPKRRKDTLMCIW